MGPNLKGCEIYGVDLTRPMGSWKTAWKTACKEAGVKYRWHDLRHTFVSRLAENASVSEETIRSLAGHVSRQMLQRYSHIRVQAKRDAIAVLEGPHGLLATQQDDSEQRKPS
jgi:integrase